MLKTNISYIIEDNQLRFSHSAIEATGGIRNAHALTHQNIFDLPTTESKATIVLQGECEGTGKRVQSVYTATWDNSEYPNILPTIEIEETLEECDEETTCYDEIVGISLKEQCNCLTYPQKAHVSKSGYYLDAVLNLSNVAYSKDCNGAVWKTIEQARENAIIQLETLISRALIKKGLTEKFSLSESVGKKSSVGVMGFGQNLPKFISTKISPRQSFSSSKLNITNYYIKPFYRLKSNNVSSPVSAVITLWIKKDGIVIEELEIQTLSDEALKIECHDLFELSLDDDSSFEFVLSLEGKEVLGYDGEGQLIYSQPFQLYPSNNIQYASCCGSVMPEWVSFLNIETKTANTIEGLEGIKAKDYASYNKIMGGVYFDVEGGCSLRNHICKSLGSNTTTLYSSFARALQLKWAVELIDLILTNANPVTNTILDLSKEELSGMMAAYNYEVERAVGYENDNGQFIIGEIAQALFNKGFKNSCYRCGTGQTMSKSYK